MTKYFGYSGLIYSVNEPDKTRFVLQTDTLTNFNDNILIANAAYITAPIWGYKELHITRLSLVYIANAANTDLFVFVCTGANPIQYIAVPVACSCTVKAGQMIVSSTPGIDIPIEPMGIPTTTTSGLQFALVNVVGVNAADDATLVIEGYYRGEPDPQYAAAPTPVVVNRIDVWPWKKGV